MTDIISVANVNKPYTFSGHLAILTETVVLTGTIAAPIASELTSGYILFFYTTVSGSYTAVSPDMEVIVTDSGGAFKGRLRVVNDAITAGILPVNEFSFGRIHVVAGDIFKVVNNYRLRDRLIEAAAAFRKDSRIDVGTYTTDFRPKANAGGAYVNWIADSSAVVFDSTYDQLVDPTSSTPPTVVWTFPTLASPNTSTSLSPTIDFTGCAAGTYIGKKVITDPDNGTSDTVHFPIILYDDMHLPLDISAPQISDSDTNGWSMTFTLNGGADLYLLPDGALVIYWEDEWYNGVKVSYGSRHASRSNIKFVGYLLRDRAHRDPSVETLVFEAVSPLQILDQLDNYSGVMTQTDGTIDSWFLWRKLNFQIMEDALARWGTTLYALHDFYYGDATYVYPEIFIQAQTAKGKITELARAIDCSFTCDRQGNFWIEKNSSMETGDRSVIPVRITLGEDEITDIEVVREHRTTVNLVECSGFSTDANPLFSRSPGYAPREGGQKLSNERLVVLQPNAQDNLNARAGLYDARANKLYNGLPTRSIKATLRGGFDVLDAAFQHEWIVLDGIMLAKRGISFSDTRTTLRSLQMQYQLDTLPSGRKVWHKVPVLMLDEETTGVAGDTYIPPTVDLPPYTPPTSTPAPYANPADYNPVPAYDGTDVLPTRLIIFDSGGAHCHVAKTWSPALSVLGYTDVSTGLTGINHWSTADPYNYKRYFSLQSTGLYRNDDPFGGGSWSLVGNNAALFGNSSRVGKFIAGSINRRGYFAILCGTHYIYTTDYWATIHDVDILGGSGVYATSLGTYDDFAISPYNNGSIGWVYASISDIYTGSDNTVLRSTDWGATWSIRNNTAAYLGALNIPYIRVDGSTPNINNSSQELYTAYHIANESAIHLSQSAGTSWAAQWHVNAGGNYWTPPQRGQSFTGWWMQTFTYDGKRISFAGTDNATGAELRTAISNDQGATRLEQLRSGGSDQFSHHINRYPVHSQAHLGWSRNLTAMYWTVDDGSSWQSASVPSGYGGASYVEWNIALLVPPDS